MDEPRELSFRAVLLGIFLAFVFGSANAYLGLKAGRTIGSTVPAVILAAALLKRRVLEQNVARTAASAGEALIGGAVFVIPSFLMAGIDGRPLWADLRSHYWQASMLLVTGGMLGVLFTILIRRPLLADRSLEWPESVAPTQTAGSPRLLFGSMAFGGFLEILTSGKGLQIFRESIGGFFSLPRSTGGVWWATPSLSPALIGIGYLIGPRLAAVSLAGGLLAWWIIIPLVTFFNPRPGNVDAIWHDVVRPIAVGAMLVGSVNALVALRRPLIHVLRGVFTARSEETREQDLPFTGVTFAIGALLVPLVSIYYGFSHGWTAAIGAALLMAVAGFLLSVLGGYMVGLVGATNHPVAGLTLPALILAALLMWTIGETGAAGIAMVLGVAAVVAIAVSVSGSLMQDLKTGQALGGTPWKMELVEMLAVAVLALFLMVPMVALHEANRATGGIGGHALPAPQAALMAQLAQGLAGGMPWGLFGIGVALGLVMVLCGARAPMLMAVGMYLPFETSSAIFLGGVMKWLADRAMGDEDARKRADEQGVSVATGLIAGESIVAVLLAVLFLAGMPSITRMVTGHDSFVWLQRAGAWLSLAGFLAIGYALLRIPTRR
jgi:putative OPT family oligopeptide transporter